MTLFSKQGSRTIHLSSARQIFWVCEHGMYKDGFNVFFPHFTRQSFDNSLPLGISHLSGHFANWDWIWWWDWALSIVWCKMCPGNVERSGSAQNSWINYHGTSKISSLCKMIVNVTQILFCLNIIERNTFIKIPFRLINFNITWKAFEF